MATNISGLKLKISRKVSKARSNFGRILINIKMWLKPDSNQFHLPSYAYKEKPLKRFWSMVFLSVIYGIESRSERYPNASNDPI